MCATDVDPASACSGPCDAASDDSVPGQSAPDDVGPLVRAAADGDEKAWSQLVDRFSSLTWAISRSYRLSPSDAADVNQVVWLRLVEHLGRLRHPERVGGWLATVTRHECLRVLERGNRDPGALPDDVVDQREGGEALVLVSERDAALHGALEQLPPRCRSLLRLLVAEPRPRYEEVSAALDMPIGSIGPTRQRCLDRLRQAVAVVGITGAW